jgi:cysteine synthase A
MSLQNITEQINNTPLIELRKIYKGKGHLYAKMEHIQPGGSVKDRVALQIIGDAYSDGRLFKGRPVIEMTSGNMGAGLAVVCGAYGNPFTAVMSMGNSPERVKILKALGANVILVPQVSGEPGKVTGQDIARAEDVAKETAIRTDAFYVDQFNNPSSVKAHYSTTGPEILAELGNRLNAFIAIVGTGGTFIGTAGYLKSKSKSVKCFAVEPRDAAFIKTGTVKNSKHIIQGTGYGIIPPLWDNSIAEDIITVSDDEASRTKEMLGKIEGLFVGFSAGANVAAAMKYLEQLNEENSCVATILCDTGFKY